jgi:transcriptional regulator NrdR family protein
MISMLCPICKAWVQVLETRKRPDNQTFRRYECGNTHRFSTTESVAKILEPKATKPK